MDLSRGERIILGIFRQYDCAKDKPMEPVQWKVAKSQLPPPLQRDAQKYLESLQEKGLIRIGKDERLVLTEQGERLAWSDLDDDEAQRLILESIAQEIEEGRMWPGQPFAISIRIRERLPRLVVRDLQRYLDLLVERHLLEQKGEEYMVTAQGEEAIYGRFDG
ncbi:MAG: hypothetical protein ACM3X3_09005 [Betaproteobacteria bacterium]